MKSATKAASPMGGIARLRYQYGWCGRSALAFMVLGGAMGCITVGITHVAGAHDPYRRGGQVFVEYEVSHRGRAVSGLDQLAKDSPACSDEKPGRAKCPALATISTTPTCDQRGASTESSQVTAFEPLRPPVLFVIDVSKSLYLRDKRGGAGISLVKAKAEEFVRSLKEDDHDVTMIAFATESRLIESVQEIPNERDESWQEYTHLYDAVVDAHRSAPIDAELVLLTDGADDGSSLVLQAALRAVAVGERRIHVLGFGGVRTESDNADVRAKKALKELAQFGSFEIIDSTQDQFDRAFQRIKGALEGRYSIVTAVSASEGQRYSDIRVRVRGARLPSGRKLVAGKENSRCAELNLSADSSIEVCMDEEQCRRAADMGFTEAQWQYANRYLEDASQKGEYLLKAANGKHSRAMNDAGVMILRGEIQGDEERGRALIGSAAAMERRRGENGVATANATKYHIPVSEN